MKKTLLTLLLACGLGFSSYTQHEFSIYGGGGLSTLNYDPSIGEQKMGFGGHLGLGYRYFFSPHWGIKIGVEAAFYNAEYKLGRDSTSTPSIDSEGNSFDFRQVRSDYTEDQNAKMLQIPLMLQFHTGGNNVNFYAAAGAKVGFPLSKEYSGSGTVKNTGYYDFEDFEYFEEGQENFGTFTEKTKGNLDLGTTIFISAETGVRWRLNPNVHLYTGAYVDYGLNEVPFAVGGKVEIAFGKLAKEKVEEPPPAHPLPPPQPPPVIEEVEEVQAEIDAIQNQILSDFRNSQTMLDAKQATMLDEIVAVLQKHTYVRFRIYGHTCDLGDEQTNLRIGYERARNAKEYIIKRGVDKKRILGIDTKLHYEPLVLNTSEENRKRNRRVEFVIEQ